MKISVKLSLVMLLCGVLAICSCKKDQKTRASAIVGTWQGKTATITHLDLVTGEQKGEPETSTDNTKVTLRENGTYTVSDGEEGTYTYNSDAKSLVITPSEGGSLDYQVLKLDEHNLTLKLTVNQTDEKIVIVGSYTK